MCDAGSLQALQLLPTKPGDHFDLVRDLDCVLPVEVQEQRVSNLLQSLLVAVCLRENSPSQPPSPFPFLHDILYTWDRMPMRVCLHEAFLQPSPPPLSLQDILYVGFNLSSLI